MPWLTSGSIMRTPAKREGYLALRGRGRGSRNGVAIFLSSRALPNDTAHGCPTMAPALLTAADYRSFRRAAKLLLNRITSSHSMN
jgi:hypothetical protein